MKELIMKLLNLINLLFIAISTAQAAETLSANQAYDQIKNGDIQLTYQGNESATQDCVIELFLRNYSVSVPTLEMMVWGDAGRIYSSTVKEMKLTGPNTIQLEIPSVSCRSAKFYLDDTVSLNKRCRELKGGCGD
jgi:hypothetical protein